MFFPVVLMLFFWVAVFGGGGYLLFRFLRAYEGRSGSPGGFAPPCSALEL